MNRRLLPFSQPALCALLISIAAVGLSCSDPSTFTLPLPKKLHTAELKPGQQDLLRCTISAPGLLAETELDFDDTFTSVFGSFVVKVEEERTVPVIVRVFGRLTEQSEEVLLGRAEIEARFAPREQTAIAFGDKDWKLSGRPIFDLNGNGAPNADDLADGFDPAPPARVLDVAPSEVQFPAGILPGADTRQVVVIENVSGLPQRITPRVVGGQGVKVARIDATGAPGKGDRELAAFVVEPFAEALLAVSFGPSNTFLVRGSLVLDSAHEDSGVVSSHDVSIIGNPDGDPQVVPVGYDPGTLNGASIGFDGDVIAYPAALLFGGQPLSPGTVHSGGVIAGLPVGSETVGDMPASAVFLVLVPPRHRLSATLSSLSDNADLGVFILDGDALSLEEGAAQIASHPGVAPESVEIRNASSTEDLRAVLVIGRLDPREASGDDVETAAFSLLAALSAGPEVETVTPDRGAFGGGTDVTITGFGFVTGATVRFGSHLADPTRTFVENDGTVVRTVSPPGSSADVGIDLSVVVLNPDGQAGTLPAPAFAYNPPNPVVTSVDPPTASTLGGTALIISGAFFDDGRDGEVPEDLSDASTVLIGGTPALDVEVVSSTLIRCSAPPGTAGFTALVVQNTAADGAPLVSADVGFVYIAPAGAAPEIDSVTPSSGPVSGNTPVVIAGSNFDDDATVRIGGTAALGVQVNAAGTRIDCRTPAAFAAGTADVVIINLDGQTTDPSGVFDYVFLPPTIDDVSPDFASQLGGTRLFVHGTDFEAGVSATLTQAALTFPAQLERVSGALVIVTVPAGLQAGPAELRIVSAVGDPSAPATVTILAPADAPPRILSVNPASVRIDQLVPITLTGTDFDPDVLLFVDDVETALTGTPTSTTLVFDAPARGEGVAILRLVNPDGQSDADALVYLSPLNPVLEDVSPDAIAAFVPGDVLTFNGSNLVSGLGSGSVQLVSDTPESGDTDGYVIQLLSSSATQIRVQVREPLPDHPSFHLEVQFPGFLDTVFSPPFSAIAPAVISAQTVQGQPVDGGVFSVLVQGAALNPSNIDAVRFTPSAGPAVDIVPTVATSAFVRADVDGDLLQGSYTVALVYAFVDENNVAATHVASAPGTFVVAGACGNTVIDPGEECDVDGPTLGGESCSTVGFFGGTLGCTNDCRFDVSTCTLCGNDNIDDPQLEECDGNDLAGAVCQDGDPDFTSGTVSCTADCRLSFLGCTECGNGLVEEPTEACDGSNLDGATCTNLGLGFDSGPLACNGSCQYDTTACDNCGDNRCGATEDFDCNPTFPGCTVCAADCVGTCGNGTCNVGETCNTCPRDCASTCNPPFTLTQTQGAGQVQRIAADLAQPFVVHVQDETGAPLGGLQITFTPPAGGAVTPLTAITDPLGNASTLGTLPRTPGLATFVASGSGPDNTTLAGAPLPMNVTATDLTLLTVQTLVNHLSAGRTDLLDAGGNPTPKAATKTQITVSSQGGMVVRADGAFYISDVNNHRVLFVDTNGTAHHIAGSFSGAAGNAAEGVLARTAPLNTPRGLALDAAGHLFIADSNNNRVKRVDANTGLITTVIGGGAVLTENVLATTAQISAPAGVAITPAGEMYVLLSTGSQHIRRVATNGLINTVVANASCTTALGVRVSSVDLTQLAFDKQGRLLFIGHVSNGGGCPVPPNTEHVLRLETNDTLTSVAGGAAQVAIGTARGATLNDPTGLASDVAGNIFLSERNTGTAHRIRRISPIGIISTVVGTGAIGNSGDGGQAASATLNLPTHLGMSAARDLFVIDEGNHNVRVVRAIGELTAPTIEVTLIGDAQSAPVNQAFGSPLGVHLEDSVGTPIAGVILTVVASAGAAAEPNQMTTDASGNATFVGFAGRSPGAYTFTITGNGPDGLPLPGSPFSLGGTGTAYPTGTIFGVVNQTATAGSGGVPGSAARARINPDTQNGGIAVDPDNGTLYVSDTQNHRVLRVQPSGLMEVIAGTGVSGRGTSGPALSVALSVPRGIALDADKNLYIVDSSNDYVRVLLGADQTCVGGCVMNVFAGNNLNDANPADGVVATGANLQDPTAVAIGPDGDVWIYDDQHFRIRRVDVVTPGIPGTISSPVVSTSCSTASGVRAAGFSHGGMAFDQSGRLYFSGTASNAGGCPLPDPNAPYVFRLETNGSLTAIAGGDTERVTGAAFGTDLDAPSGLAVDEGGNLFITENSSHRIRRVDLLGRMTVVMGDGAAGLTGDGTVTSTGRLSSPSALALSSGGDLYIADGGNDIVRALLGAGQSTSPTARLVIDTGNNQSLTIGQNTAQPLRVQVLEDGTDAPVPGVPITFAGIGNVGDAIALPGSNTDSNGFASTGVRIGRTVGAHSVSASAQTWLESIALGGSPQSFTITGVRPTALSSVAVFNSFGVPGANPLNGTGLTIPATAGNGSLTDAGVAIAADGTLFLADTNNHRVMEISPEGALSVFAGTGTAGFVDNVDRFTARFSAPRGVAVDTNNNVYVVDGNNDRVRLIDTNGNVTTFAGGNVDTPGHGDGNDPAAVNFSVPVSVTFGPDDALYVTDDGHNNIRRIELAPFAITTPVVTVNCTAAVPRPGLIDNSNVAFDSTGRLLFVAQYINGGSCPHPVNTDMIVRGEQLPGAGTITTFTPLAGSATPANTGDGLAANNSRLTAVRGIVVDSVDGDIYFVENSGSHRLRRIPGGVSTNPISTVLGQFNTQGFSALTLPGGGLMTFPDLMVRDANGDLYFTEQGSDAVRLFVP